VQVIGIDGCRGGWVGVVLSELTWAVTGPTVESLVDAAGPVDTVAIDIPIGLPRTGARAADLAVRALLGPRRSSVFPTPVRDALEATSLKRANAVSPAATGAGVSAQAYALRSRVMEVGAWAKGAGSGVDVREAHPEASFAVMAGRPLTSSKKTWNGLHERLELLRSRGIELPPDLGRAGGVSADDVLDAAACASTARRIAAGEAIALPSPPEDLDGWAAAIWV
jgi:predicted RNase H-like nuclease